MHRLATLVVVVSAVPAFANTNVGPGRCGEGGNIHEQAIGPSRFVVHLTGRDSKINDAAVPGWPRTINVRALRGGFAITNINAPANPLVCDAINQTFRLPPKKNLAALADTLGAESDLYLESVNFDPTAGNFYIEGIFGLIHNALGPHGSTAIPDLYADTNNDGSLDAGDKLYGWVYLRQWLPTPPTFTLGDSFNIVNGISSSLPGMIFSTTPFSFDPATGSPGGTPFTGSAVAESMHVPSVPAPGALALFGLGTSLLMASRRWREPVGGSVAEGR